MPTITSKLATVGVVKNDPSSNWYRDSNSQPIDHESPPITTRPGLPPKNVQTREH